MYLDGKSIARLVGCLVVCDDDDDYCYFT